MNNTEKNTDKIWVDNFNILFNNDRLIEFLPTKDMSINEKLNALVRLSFYLSILLLICKNKYSYIIIFLGALIITYFIYVFRDHNDTCDLVEKFNSNNSNTNLKECNNQPCTYPTKNNPFMNILTTDPRNRKPACKPNKVIKKKIEANFNHNLYRDVTDVFNRNNSQRSFYTMPNTSLPNKQDDFAKWLYKVPKTCKEGNVHQCIGNLHTSLRNTHTGATNPWSNGSGRT